ncbi:ABC transporter permease [Methylophaga sp.]|uniref:ABC transporter permease n=1 Tax=Methylophaga sp. TaxID=2024840 RepID=UPI003F6A4294
MSFLPVFLWTDILIYFLLAVVAAGVLYVRKRPHLITPWKSVLKRRRGMISIMVLACYVLIGLSDSIHFRLALESDSKGTETHYATEVISLFDLAVTPLREQVEKTYSAPFAHQLYVKEMQTAEDGTLIYNYPRLEYGASHLDLPENKWADIKQTIIRATLMSVSILFLVFVIHSFGASRQKGGSVVTQASRILKGQSDYPWQTFYLMLFILVLIAANLIALSANYHVFGTDKVGQDVLYQALKSIRTGLVIGTITTLVMLPLAILLGIAAGYFRGWIDDVIQYVYTTLNSIPGVLLIAAAVLILQVYMNNNPEQFETIAERADMRLLFLCIILGVTSWTGLCRILRAETLKLREAEYVLASRALGASNFSILHKHILPNLMHLVMIAVVLDFSGLVLAEAVLSYVGVGVDPSMISWGNMINSARLEMARDPVVWWSLTAAFISMFILVLAANLFADVVRDAFDPRMQGAR